MFTEITGAEFKERVTSGPVYKMLSDDHIHNEFEYKLGHNEDTIPFNPTEQCRAGGLYFSTLDNLGNFYSYGEEVATITLYDDSRVYVEDLKFKADKFRITDITPLHEFCREEEVFFKFVTKMHPKLAEHKLGPEFCIEMVKTNYDLLPLIPKRFRTPWLFDKVIRERPHAFYRIPHEEQTEELCALAVAQSGVALSYVPEHLKTEEIMRAAVKSNGFALEYISAEKQTEELCRLAVENQPRAKDMVKESLRWW